MADYVAPGVDKDGFHCPYCGVYAHQEWYNTLNTSHRSGNFTRNGPILQVFAVTICGHCNQAALWTASGLVYPGTSSAPLAAPDMPDDVRVDYDEARNVLSLSPRSSAALLRLALQKLCKHLGQKGENINEDIKQLVKDGLPPQVQKVMDIVRIVGNNAVHPGELDLRDDQTTALKLFALINLIVQEMITRPAEITALYSEMPQGALDGIDKRDNRTHHP